jgi:RNA recognition motif-containing protein
MGRYTNVQAYADNSPSIRTMFYEQATGIAATSSASPSHNASGGKLPCLTEEARAAGETRDNNIGPASRAAMSCDTSTLFVGGLHPRIGDLHLRKLFSPYGEIVRIHVPSDPKHNNIVQSKAAMPAKYTTGLHQSKGFAFVEYSQIESARLAISRLDGRQLMGRSLAVRPSRKKTTELSRAGFSGGEMNTPGGAKVSVEDARREYNAVQSKIEAVKRAINKKKQGL